MNTVKGLALAIGGAIVLILVLKWVAPATVQGLLDGLASFFDGFRSDVQQAPVGPIVGG